MQIIEAPLTFFEGAFRERLQVEMNAAGVITRVGEGLGASTKRLTDQALLPGFVNAHSHAFQRGLRGHGETFPEGAGSFWTWREAMYDLVGATNEEIVFRLSRQAFAEMRDAGITCVGEFHYLHHDKREAGFAFDQAVLAAAEDVGIRIVLLQAMYATGGIGASLTGGQRRFRVDSVDEHWAQMERLREAIAASTQSLGVVAHSIRAVALDDIKRLHTEAKRRGLVFHMHVEEQRQEIEACVDAYGQTPMALLCEHLEIDERFTAVHCTHTDPADMERYLSAGGNVCICPLTEANLGDGIADVGAIHDGDGSICIGTDSNARLCMAEELRWLEYVQRLDGEERGAVTTEDGACAEALFAMGTINGARSLGVEAGEIRPGLAADFVTLDLESPSLAGWTPETLLSSFIFGCGNSAIASTCIGGAWRESEA